MRSSFLMPFLYPESCKHQDFLSFGVIPAWPPKIFFVLWLNLVLCNYVKTGGSCKMTTCSHIPRPLLMRTEVRCVLMLSPWWNCVQIRVFRRHVIFLCFYRACEHADDHEHRGGNVKSWRGISFPPIWRSGVGYFFFSSVEYCMDRRRSPV